MKRLHCDINLGGCTEQFLTYNKRTATKEQFIKNLEGAISYRAKTKPFKMARRLACLIGLTYDKLEGDHYILDCIITAFNNLENNS